jgi:hypothetical protein
LGGKGRRGEGEEGKRREGRRRGEEKERRGEEEEEKRYGTYSPVVIATLSSSCGAMEVILLNAFFVSHMHIYLRTRSCTI